MQIKLKYLLFILFIASEFLFNQIVVAQNDTTVTNISHDSTHTNDSLTIYIPLHEFTYAGTRRFMIDGSIPLRKTVFRPVRASIIGGVYLSMLVGIHLHQQQAWWSGNR